MKKSIKGGIVTIIWLLMLIVAASFIFILLWMIISSFRESARFNETPFKIFDFGHYTLENYKEIFTDPDGILESIGGNFPFMLKNTFIYLVGTLIIAIIIPPLTGYVVSKFNFKIKPLILWLTVIMMVVPTYGSLTATYVFQEKIGLMGTFSGLFIMSAGGIGFGTLVYGNFFKAIPDSFKEAAYLDGAGDFQVYFKVMFPQAKGIIIVQCVGTIIGAWNNYLTPYLYLPDNPVIALGIYNISQHYTLKSFNTVAFASLSFVSIVSVLIFAIFNKQMMTNMSVGGIKG